MVFKSLHICFIGSFEKSDPFLEINVLNMQYFNMNWLSRASSIVLAFNWVLGKQLRISCVRLVS